MLQGKYSQEESLIKAPEEHIGPNVAVVTTSISLAVFSIPVSSTISIISSAVTTTASPFLIDLFVYF